MATQNQAFALYRESFPSDKWLNRYYGQDQKLAPKGTSDKSLELYRYLRNVFDGTLRGKTMHQIRLADRRGGLRKIYVFKDGQLSDWARNQLEQKDLLPEPTNQAQRELCTEFITKYRTGAFSEEAWWRWFVEDNTIGIEPTPTANLAGGNRPRRSLTDILKGK